MPHALFERALRPFHTGADFILLSAAHGIAKFLRNIGLRARKIPGRLLHLFLQLVVLVEQFLLFADQLL